MAKQSLKPFQLTTTALEIGGLYRSVNGEESPLILMLHSSGGGAQSLVPLAQRLQAPGLIVIPDLCGYGRTRSVSANSADALEQHLDVIDAVADAHAIGDQPMIVIGHSMGGFLALRMAQRRSVAAVVAIEPVAFSVLDPVADAAARAEDLEKVMGLDASIKSGNAETGLAGFISYWGGADWTTLSEEVRTALLALALQMARETFTVAHDNTAPESYREISSPVMLIQGDQTRAPANAVVRRLSALLPAAETITVEGAGHMGPVRQSAAYADKINSFLMRHVSFLTNH